MKYVENELYLYRMYKLSLEELKRDLEEISIELPQKPFEIVPIRNGPGDPVSLTAIRTVLIEEKIKQNSSRIRKIEMGYSLLNPEEKELVDKKYFSGIDYTNEQLIIQFKLRRNRFYQLRDGVIYKYALVLGIF